MELKYDEFIGENMLTENVIKNNLDFLINDYGFKFYYYSNGKQYWCNLTNAYGSVNYYSFSEFGEFELSITIKGKKMIVLDSFLELKNSPLIINKKLSFFEFVFKDHRKLYWEKIATAFKAQINEIGTLYGLRLK